MYRTHSITQWLFVHLLPGVITLDRTSKDTLNLNLMRTTNTHLMIHWLVLVSPQPLVLRVQPAQFPLLAPELSFLICWNLHHNLPWCHLIHTLNRFPAMWMKEYIPSTPYAVISIKHCMTETAELVFCLCKYVEQNQGYRIPLPV